MLDAVNDFGTQFRLPGMFAPSAQATAAGDDYIFDARFFDRRNIVFLQPVIFTAKAEIMGKKAATLFIGAENREIVARPLHEPATGRLRTQGAHGITARTDKGEARSHDSVCEGSIDPDGQSVKFYFFFQDGGKALPGGTTWDAKAVGGTGFDLVGGGRLSSSS